MADRNDYQQTDGDGAGENPGIFDLYGDPPRRDPRTFGKIPVIKEDEADDGDNAAGSVLDDDYDLGYDDFEAPEEATAEVKAAADAEAAGLQHWTAPPTGQLPAVLSSRDGKQKAGLWGDVAGPSWQNDETEWSGPDLADVFADTDAVDLVDEDDDDEEDEEYRQPLRAARPQPEPAHRRPDPSPPPPSSPPLAASPQRRPPPVAARRTEPPVDDRLAAAFDDPTVPPISPATPASPAIRSDVTPAPAPAPAPGPAPAPIPEPRPEPATTSLPRPNREVLSETATGPLPHPGPSPDRSGWPDSPRHRAPSADDTAAIPAAAPAPPVAERPGAAMRSRLLGDPSEVPSIDDIQFDDAERSGPRSLSAPVDAASAPGWSPSAPDLSNGSRSPRADFGRGEEYDEYDYDEYPEGDDYDDYDEHRYEGAAPARTGGRNIPQAIAVGVALVGVLLGAMWLGPETTLLLVAALALLGVMELYNAMRRAGLRPAALLGIVGTVAAPVAAYYRGDAALPLIVGLTVVFGSLWYLVGADTERPVLNLSLTMMGILWVGGLASFAGLALRSDGGIELLLAAIIITVVSDTMAYIGGRAYGSRPFHPASPNKTWEGTFTGFLGALFAGFAIGVTEMGTLWEGNLLPAIVLGAVVGVLAPIGDLAESVVKRDLGVKDMGSLLPGHGGVLDRVDALLFALPGAYYLGLIAGLL